MLVRAAATAPLAVACAATGAAVAPGPRTPLKVGLVGCGGRGIGAATNALRAEDGTVVLTAMADLFPDRLEGGRALLEQWLGEELLDRVQVPEERRFTGFDAYRRLIDSGVDVVLLATPPVFRPEHLDYAIAKGVHVFCEKPMALDGRGVRSVLASAARAREAGLSLVSGFCWRYNVRHRELYARVHDGWIGDLQTVYGTYNATPVGTHAREEGWSDQEWMLRNWHHFYELSGDHVTEQAVHTLDKIAWAFGDRPPLSVVATGGCQTRTGPEKGNVFDHFQATFDYGDGAKAFLACRQMPNTATENNDWLWGTGGRAEIQNWTPLHVIEGRRDWTYEGEGNDMYQTEHDELFASIRSGRPINDGEWMARSTLLAVMVRMSAYTGRVISWDEALASEEDLTRAHWALDAVTARPMAIPGHTTLV